MKPSAGPSIPGVYFSGLRGNEEPEALGNTYQEYPSRGSCITSREPRARVQEEAGNALSSFVLCCHQNALYHLCHHFQTGSKPLPGAHGSWYATLRVLLGKEVIHIK